MFRVLKTFKIIRKYDISLINRFTIFYMRKHLYNLLCHSLFLSVCVSVCLSQLTSGFQIFGKNLAELWQNSSTTLAQLWHNLYILFYSILFYSTLAQLWHNFSKTLETTLAKVWHNIGTKLAKHCQKFGTTLTQLGYNIGITLTKH